MTFASGQQGTVMVESGDVNVGASLSYPEGACTDENGRYCSAVADSSAAGGALIGVYATTSTITNNSMVAEQHPGRQRVRLDRQTAAGGH